MKAMILAAGRGERLRPLTDACPKPLLVVAGKPLIVWHLERLRQAGFNDVVINHAHLGQMLVDTLADGSRYGVRIHWSAEPQGALETAGGIRQALPLLGDEIFLVINGDIFCDWDVQQARGIAERLKAGNDLAHLVLVPNPPHHPEGDFIFFEGRVHDAPDSDERSRRPPGPVRQHTFSGIGVYKPALFAPIAPGSRGQLAPLLRAAMHDGVVSGELHQGRWHDVGTPQRLAQLNIELTSSASL